MALPDFELPSPDELRDSFARRIAVAIAAATLLAAIVGFLQNEASTANSAAALKAQRYAIEATQALVLAQEHARVQVEGWAISLEQRIQASNISQQLIYAPDAEAAMLKTQEATWTSLADRTEQLSGIARDSPDGPVQDPTFPSRLLESSSKDAYRLQALQDAANEVGGLWSNQATAYTAVLAILAVALYLLGFSLTMRVRRAKRLFAVAGVTLIIGAAGWTATGLAASPRTPPDEAADAYAQGLVEMRTAYDQAGLATAEASLTRAIELRPTFARAFLARADVRFRIGSPQQQGFLSVVTDDALRRSTDDLAQAASLGLDDITLLWDLGFQRFLEGLREGGGAHLDESIALTRRVIGRTADNPVPRFNLGVALLAAGRIDEARTAYADGIARVLFLDVAAGTKRDNPYAEVQYVAGALTDLGILVGARPDLAPIVTELRSTIIGSVARGSIDPGPPGGADVTVDRLAADVFPAIVQWRGDLKNFVDTKEALTIIWSRREAGGGDWAVMPEVSSLDATPTENVDPSVGTYFHLDRYIGTTSPPQCLPDGTYRVELFVDGRPIGSAEATAASGHFEAFAASDLGGALCRPSDWKPDPGSTLGTAAGYLGPNDDRGVGLIHLQAPTALGDPATLSVEMMDAAVKGLSGSLPGPATYDETEGTQDRYFMGLDGSRWRWYNYPGGYVRVGAGIDPSGGVYVGYVFGPKDWFDGTEWMRIDESFETFQ